MAEATLTAETEVTPPNDEVLEAPNPAPEADAPPADPEIESPYADDDILKELGLSDAADGNGDGAGTASDGRVPSEYEGLSPEEIERKVEEKAQAKATQTQTAAARQNYVEGLRRYVANAVTEADRQADANGGVLDRDWVKTNLNRIKGDYDQLIEYDTAVARQAGATQVANLYGQASVQLLGQDGANALFKANHQDPVSYMEGFALAYAKKHGYVEPKEVKAREVAAGIKGFRNAEAKHDAALKGRGMSLKDITGNGGSDLPPIRGGTNNKPDAVLANPNASREERDAAFEAKHGFRPGV